ncbi:ImmA/IrrE family metallo-endopeptidase [Streptomyces sp. CRPSP2-6A1]|uniref:ImmA/IrrE family metallo-endopeptidase n=1 Tax=Streptomyces sp. CRPSP2-6A1 TaxID=2799588 RepID=UPI0018F0EFE5|nr:ImmA/IrrE family metallo-endopeptidase [Streptomyces sp. CRPSP2-6A1]MBJ7000163.1 ImmA/IrrE family metallo-endopeptidase [Streptomyces sp. CRPSP2-6A1]
MTRHRFVQEAPLQAEAMISAVERLHPGALEALRADPLAELHRWTDIRVSLEPEADRDGRCSVAGSYRSDSDPPTLVVGASRSIRRRGFTGLHELGHHLQQTDAALGQRLFDWDDSEAFEEAACDAFAARILVPEGRISEEVRRRGPSADDVVTMFRTSQASREACCVRAAQYLAGGGAVVLLDVTGQVLFAASRGMIPPARGSDQSGTPLVSAALGTRATVQRDKTYVVYRSGGRSDLLYGQAAWCDEDYLITVLAEDSVAWRAFTAPRPNIQSSWFGSWWDCETCGDSFKITERACEECGEARCAQGHCGCTTARSGSERVCEHCFMNLAPSRFEGTSTTCRDCS